MKTSVYRKPTHTNLYLKYSSHHPDSVKLGILKTLLTRAERICDQEYVAGEIEHIRNTFRDNGYPEEVIQKVIKKQRSNHGQTVRDSRNKHYVSIPYAKGISERIAKILAPHDIVVAHS